MRHGMDRVTVRVRACIDYATLCGQINARHGRRKPVTEHMQTLAHLPGPTTVPQLTQDSGLIGKSLIVCDYACSNAARLPGLSTPGGARSSA